MLHHPPGEEDNPVRVFESANILIYLCDTFDKQGTFLPLDKRQRTECLNWLFWVQGSAPFLGGGFGHFYNYAPIKVEYAINRYSMEAKRQLDVLDRQLADGRAYLCGDQYTIADMAAYPWYGWVVLGKIYGDSKTFLEAEKYTHVVAWAERIAAREATRRGTKVNRPFGEPSDQLHERHARTDFETKTQDKLQPK
eukprot:TRINITY_DN9983_c0_g1_i11.p2 TRINITY_DN9983_c0_g1~~TRINITY_DN9983_c0_g1_i11.p2  ORF type:complete len:195 (-),score=56.68 TRINITY_DN9983_c0_g1_i11:310-894(-)